MGEKPTYGKPADKPVEKKYKTVPLTEELKKKNEAAKVIADELMRVGVWTWDGRADDIVNFAYAEADKAIATCKFIEAEKRFDIKNPIIISGAEYRLNFAVMRAIKVVDKLSPEAQKLVFQDLFNRDTMPDFAKDEAVIRTGMDKLIKYNEMVSSEYAMRALADDVKFPKSKEAPKTATTGTTTGSSTTPATGTGTTPATGTPIVPKVTEPPKSDPSKIGGNDSSEDMSALFDAEWPAKAMAELRRISETKTAALNSLGLPGSIADALNAANLQLDGVSVNAEAPKLAFAKAKTQTSKEAVVAA